MSRLLNKALFEVEDTVRSRNVDGRIQGKVEKEEIITNSDGLSYQIIWIGDTFFSAYDFEPVNAKDRKAYYAEYDMLGDKPQRLNLSKVKKKVATFNLKKIKDG